MVTRKSKYEVASKSWYVINRNFCTKPFKGESKSLLAGFLIFSLLTVYGIKSEMNDTYLFVYLFIVEHRSPHKLPVALVGSGLRSP